MLRRPRDPRRGAFAFAATVLVAVARRAREGSSGASILLAGVMVNSIAASMITFLKTLVSPSRALELLRWLTGYIDLPTGIGLAVVAFYVVAGAAVLLFDAARMNLLALGDESAESLGVDVRALELRVFVASSAVVGAIVSVTGLIGFIGLVVRTRSAAHRPRSPRRSFRSRSRGGRTRSSLARSRGGIRSDGSGAHRRSARSPR